MASWSPTHLLQDNEDFLPFSLQVPLQLILIAWPHIPKRRERCVVWTEHRIYRRGQSPWWNGMLERLVPWLAKHMRLRKHQPSFIMHVLVSKVLSFYTISVVLLFWSMARFFLLLCYLLSYKDDMYYKFCSGNRRCTFLSSFYSLSPIQSIQVQFSSQGA